jgi:hypothetical protein
LDCFDDFSFMLMVCSVVAFAAWHQTPFGGRLSGLFWVLSRLAEFDSPVTLSDHVAQSIDAWPVDYSRSNLQESDQISCHRACAIIRMGK